MAAWAPLWFGNQDLRNENNLTYGTSQVVLALVQLRARYKTAVAGMLEEGVRWLESSQNEDGGWGGGVTTTPSSIEETALAVDALLAAVGGNEICSRGLEWLIRETSHGKKFPPSPIGFYFAKLWYYETLYPLIWTVSALTRAAGK